MKLCFRETQNHPILGLKKERNEIYSICFTKSVSLIKAIFSDGSIFAAAAKGNVNEELFKEFLKELKHFIELDLDDNLWNWLVLIDNAPTHHSFSVKKCIEKSKIKFHIYSSIFSGVSTSREIFFIA